MISQNKIIVGVTIFTCLLLGKIYSVNSLALSYKEVITSTKVAEQTTTEKLALSDETTIVNEGETTSSYFTTEYTPSENSTKNDEEQTTLSVTTELSMTTEEQLHDQTTVIPMTTEEQLHDQTTVISTTTEEQLHDHTTIISMTEETTQCSQGSGCETGDEAPESLVRTDTPVTENTTTYDENEKSTTLPSDVEDNTASYEMTTVKQADNIEEETTSVFIDNSMNNNNEEKWIQISPPAIGEEQQSSTNISVENQITKGKNISLTDLILLKNQQAEKEYQSITIINTADEKEKSSTDKPATSTPEYIENYD